MRSRSRAGSANRAAKTLIKTVDGLIKAQERIKELEGALEWAYKHLAVTHEGDLGHDHMERGKKMIREARRLLNECTE